MKMNRQTLMLCFVLAVAGSLGACSHGRTVEAAREERQPTVTPAEQEFMMKAADAMLSNVDVARLAMHKSQNPDVRDFANTIQRALHKKSWSVIDRPYSLGCATVGALYERPRCIFCAKPIQSDDASTLQDLTD